MIDVQKSKAAVVPSVWSSRPRSSDEQRHFRRESQKLSHRQHWLDGLALDHDLSRLVDVLEVVGADEAIEGEASHLPEVDSGTLERRGLMIHVLVSKLESLTGSIAELKTKSRGFR